MIPKKVTLLLPGYSIIARQPDDGQADLSVSITPDVLETFLFTHDEQHMPWQAQLAQCLEVDVVGGRRLPSARLCLSEDAVGRRLAGTKVAPYVVRADPVYLKADRDNAKLIAPEQLDLSGSEADQMLAALNEFNKDDGLVFFRHQPHEWFMCGMQADELETYPPSFLANRNASSFLPGGDEAAHWRRLMTELQMLLHAHPVNLQREQRALMPVNGVWFWGGAQLPVVDAANDEVIVFADDMEAVALADHLGVTTQPLAVAADATLELPSENSIVIVDTCIASAWLAGDEQRLDTTLQNVNQTLLQPLSHQVASGQLASIDVLTEDGLKGVCNLETTSASSQGAADSRGWLKRLLTLVGR